MNSPTRRSHSRFVLHNPIWDPIWGLIGIGFVALLALVACPTDDGGSDPDPIASIAVSPDSVAEGGVMVTATVTLDRTVDSDTTFTLALDNTAVDTDVDANVDGANDDDDATFANGVNTVTIAANNTTGTAMIAIIDDTIAESAETFTVRVTAVLPEGVTLPTEVATVTITDNDSPGVTAVATDDTTTETNETATIMVRLNTLPTAEVTVTPASSNTDEGMVTTPDNGGALTFTTDNWSTAQTVTVTGVNDAVADGDQRYEIRFTVVSVDTDYDDIAVTPVTITNSDSDFEGTLTVGNVATATIDEGGSTTFTISLDTALRLDDLTIPFTVTGGVESGDWSLTSDDTSMLTVGAGVLTVLVAGYTTADIPVTLTFSASDDDIVEGAETATIGFPDPFGGNPLGGSDPVITISASDGPATVTVTAPASLVEGDSGGADIDLEVVSDKVVEGDIVVTLTPGSAMGNASAIETDDFTTAVSAQMITLTDMTSQPVTIGTVAGDTMFEGDITIPVMVTLTTDPTGLAMSAASVDVVIIGDDPPIATLADDDVAGTVGTPQRGEDSGDIRSLFVTDIAGVDSFLFTNAIVTYSFGGGADIVHDYTATVSFPAIALAAIPLDSATGTFNIPSTSFVSGGVRFNIDIGIVDDTAGEPEQMFTFDLTSITFDDANATIVDESTARTIPADGDDDPTATIAIIDADAYSDSQDPARYGLTLTNLPPGEPFDLVVATTSGDASIGTDYTLSLVASGMTVALQGGRFSAAPAGITAAEIILTPVSGTVSIDSIVTVTLSQIEPDGGGSYDIMSQEASATIHPGSAPNGQLSLDRTLLHERRHSTAEGLGTFTLDIDTAPDNTVATVRYTLSNGDYTPAFGGDITGTPVEGGGTFTMMTDADGESSGVLTIRAVSDSDRRSEPVTFTITDIAFADGYAPTVGQGDIADNGLMLTILDDDGATATVELYGSRQMSDGDLLFGIHPVEGEERAIWISEELESSVVKLRIVSPEDLVGNNAITVRGSIEAGSTATLDVDYSIFFDRDITTGGCSMHGTVRITTDDFESSFTGIGGAGELSDDALAICITIIPVTDRGSPSNPYPPDGLLEGDETIILRIDEIDIEGEGILTSGTTTTLLRDRPTTIYIGDIDVTTAIDSVTAAPTTIAEGASTTVTVDLNGLVLNEDLVLPYTITGVDVGDIDTPLTGGALTIPKRSIPVFNMFDPIEVVTEFPSATLDIPALADDSVEGAEMLTITFGAPTSGDYSGLDVTNGSVTITIND